MKRAWRWAGGIALALALGVAALLVIADSSVGHRFIADRIAALSPSSGLRIRVGRIDGSIYRGARLHDVRLYDSAGLFFEAPDVALDWRPVKWLANRLDIDALTAPSAALIRLPKLKPSGRNGPILPGFDIRVGRFEIARLAIGKAVAGRPRSGRLAGTADIRDGRALVRLDAMATGGDRLALKFDAEPDRDRFDMDAVLDAPAGGVLGAAIGTRRPVMARLQGDGHWRDWRGGLAATASGKRVVSLDLTQRKGRFDLSGQLAPSLITQGKLMRLSAPSVRVKGNAMLRDRRLDTHLALGSDALAVAANGIVDLGRNMFDGMKIEARLLRPPALFPNMTGRDVRLQLRLQGGFATARFDYLLTTPHVQFDATGFDAVRASGSGRLSPAPVTVPLTLTARQVTGVGTVAGGILANLRVTGRLKVTPKALTGDALDLTSDKLKSKITVFVDLVTGRYDVALAGGLARYLIPGLGIVDVKTEVKIVPGPGGHGTMLTGRGWAWVRRLDNQFLAGLAGGLPHIETGLARGPDGIVHFIGLRLTAPSIRLSGDGYRRKDGTFHFEGSGTQARYGPVRMVLDGPIDRPHLDLRLARPMDALGLRDVHAILDPTPQGFAWRAEGGSLLGPFGGNGAIVLPSGQPATVQFANLQASGLVARGALRSLPGGFQGQLGLGGSGISGTLGFAPQGTLQRIDAHLTARDAKLLGPPLIAARRGKLDAVLLLDPAGVSIDATAQGMGLRYGNLALARLEGSAKLRGGSGEVRATLAGSRGRAFALTTVAQVSPNRIVLSGQGTVDRLPLRLDAPAVLTRDGDGWALSPTALSFAGGTARVGGRFGGAATAIDATVERMPLTVLDIFYPQLGLGGSASGRFAFSRPASGAPPTGSADLRIKGLTRSGLVLSSRPVDAAVTAALTPSGAALRAIAASGGQVIGRAQLRIAPLGGGGALADRLTSAPLFAQLRYNGPADTLWRLTGVEGIDLSGPVAVGADARGTIDHPQIMGVVRTDNLRIESPVSGTVLTGVRGTGRFGGSRLAIDSFTATAGKGTLAGRASFDLAAANGFGMDISATAANAELIRRDDIGATVTGPLAIKSDGARGTIAGDVTLDRSAYRLGRASAAAAVPRLRVRELNRPPDEAEPGRAPSVWALDLKARAPSRLAVTGLGLDSEWRADLRIGGTLDSPAITGRADLVRGGYEFAGRRFDLARGSIRFQGASPPDPILDIAANANLTGLNATIKVTGTGLRPEITFASTPALPQDELLSRLLFGTSITNLSAPEALQLASAVASLRGGGGLDPINALRRAVGLDRLRILPADATTGQRTSIAAGKYITRRAYVEVVTDGAGYSATRVEFEVTRWLSLLSTISTIGRQSATVRVSKDY